MEPDILIVGGGAIGGTTTILLHERGFQPTLLTKYPGIKRKAENEGLSLKGHSGSYLSHPKVLLASELEGKKYDIVMIATKATDLREAANQILPYLKPESLVVSLQNGICIDLLAGIVGEDRTVGCVVGWGATMTIQGEYDMTSGGEFILGTTGNIALERLDSLGSILQHVVPTKLSENIISDLYSKLIVNACINTLGVICGLTLGKMLARTRCRRLFIGIIFEAMEVAQAMHLLVPPYAGKLDYYRFTASKSLIAGLRRHIVILAIGIKFRRLKSSSLQSLERGKPTEVDFFNGYISRKAKENGIKTPLNDKLTTVVKEIENGKRKSGLHNFNEPFFRKIAL